MVYEIQEIFAFKIMSHLYSITLLIALLCVVLRRGSVKRFSRTVVENSNLKVIRFLKNFIKPVDNFMKPHKVSGCIKNN